MSQHRRHHVRAEPSTGAAFCHHVTKHSNLTINEQLKAEQRSCNDSQGQPVDFEGQRQGLDLQSQRQGQENCPQRLLKGDMQMYNSKTEGK